MIFAAVLGLCQVPLVEESFTSQRSVFVQLGLEFVDFLARGRLGNRKSHLGYSLCDVHADTEHMTSRVPLSNQHGPLLAWSALQVMPSDECLPFRVLSLSPLFELLQELAVSSVPIEHFLSQLSLLEVDIPQYFDLEVGEDPQDMFLGDEEPLQLNIDRS